MKNDFKQLIAFLKKDFLIEASYRFAFIFNFVNIFVGLLTYYFIDKLFDKGIVVHLAPFGVNYFSYVLVGLGLFSFVGAGLSGIPERLRAEQMMGTLESILVAPIKLYIIPLALSLWNFTFSSLNILIYLLAGIFIFKIDLSNINYPSAIIVLILSIISLNSIGVISASFIMAFKRGNPIAWVSTALFGLLSGIYFPVTVLPDWLKFISQALPLTYSTRALELAIYKDATLGQLHKEVILLVAFALLLVPASALAFKAAIKKVKDEGTLGHY